ncbi:MAG: bifunctional 2-C-methyl-D-erythritol 4-phosphate cytidylyltransferase/2-C-methyl-D-erythritol 2,4-cyclodiphosphate synthase [Pontixanthobacter sp.]
MAPSDHVRQTAAIVVAGGKGLRAGQAVPKQFAPWRGKAVLRHSVEEFVAMGCHSIVVVIPDGSEEIAGIALSGLETVQFVTGGATRRESVNIGLKALVDSGAENVLIHDAARPVISTDVVHRLLNAIGPRQGAIPVLPVVDSLAIEDAGRMVGSANRAALRRVQTPQAFRFADIYDAHRSWIGPGEAGDDAQVFMAAGGKILHVDGDETLKKLTFAEDFKNDMTMPHQPIVRTGFGYDVHSLVEGEELWLGGLKLPHSKGLVGHSDADVALHAIVDALLGAAAAGDIGEHFPPSDDRWKGAASSAFVRHAAELVKAEGYAVGNVDLTIICEAPKIGPHRMAMREKISEFLDIATDQVSVKATTTERLGFTGREEGIAAQAVATLIRQAS